MNAKHICLTGRRLKAASLAFILAISGTTGLPLLAPTAQAVHAASVSMEVRERLSRYGVWQISQPYGEVWVPSVAATWRPYTVGRWVWTDDGWYWESGEPFGAVVFHYGRWAYDDDLGWVWVAGDEWAPAWVVWRQSNDYVGWLPAPPPEERVVFRDVWWSFVPVVAISAVEILPALRPVEDNVTIVRNTTIIDQRVVVNNVYNNQTVRVENKAIPINAGPMLARLPQPVAGKIRAATIAPPAKGSLASARLDVSKAREVKLRAASLQPGGSPPSPGKPPVGAVPIAPAPTGPAKSNDMTGNKTPVITQPALPRKPAVSAVDGKTQQPSRRRLPATTGKGAPGAMTEINRNKVGPQRVHANHEPRKLPPTNPAIEQRHRAETSPMQSGSQPQHRPAGRPMLQRQTAHMNAPHRPQAAPHKPVSPARKPMKCDPHDPRCKAKG
ncbi:DUF6600 domain-containing protein [Mesorhizobium sp.]|uniref:DUF6600 domain-containing protein n=1 Tax=Mesorhizobium sp. TaxID=1871066 RepID=UPI002DDCDE2F|nr:DUF6600 domain-containing protein [Mesorhizobium sp.]